MACEVYKSCDPEIPAVFLCRGRRRDRLKKCGFCGHTATLLCDHITGSKTCDANICQCCARHVGKNVDYCPKHQAQGELAL